MIKRSSPLSIRMSFNLIDKLENKIKEKEFENVSDAIRKYVELGMLAESFKSKIKDPEFIESIEFLKQGDNLFHWAKNLKDNEMDAIAIALQMEKEKRYEE